MYGSYPGSGKEESVITWHRYKEGAMKKFLDSLGRFVDFLDTLVLVLLFTALAFSIGYHMGFSVGLDTKVTLVGEKYTMKVKGNVNR